MVGLASILTGQKAGMIRIRKQLIPVFFVILTILFIFGCSTLPRDKGQKQITRKMLVTAYDAGQKSTGWKYKYGCCLMPPVYAYGPSEGERKKVGVTSSGTKAKKGTIAADISRFESGNDEAYLKQLHIPLLRRAGDFHALSFHGGDGQK